MKPHPYYSETWWRRAVEKAGGWQTPSTRPLCETDRAIALMRIQQADARAECLEAQAKLKAKFAPHRI